MALHPEVAKRLRTFRHLPKDIVLAMGTREFSMGHHATCMCGWALRESLGGALGRDPQRITVDDIDADDGFVWEADKCAARFGGSASDWNVIYYSCTGDEFEYTEEAFARRVAECAR